MWAPPPEQIVFDAGTELRGTFKGMSELLGSDMKCAPTESPWQNALVERHGGVLGDIVAMIVMETATDGFK